MSRGKPEKATREPGSGGKRRPLRLAKETLKDLGTRKGDGEAIGGARVPRQSINSCQIVGCPS
jgi:hypothetical protein